MTAQPAQLDPEVIAAVEEAVRHFEQPDVVAKRLIAWLSELSRGQAARDDDERRFDSLRAAIRVESAEGGQR